jgi:hypothetical protein
MTSSSQRRKISSVRCQNGKELVGNIKKTPKER